MNEKNGADLEGEVFEESRIERGRKNRNPYISSMKEDRLYHIGLVAGPQNMKEMFGDVKYVCMGGTPQRMELFARYIVKEIGYHLPTGTCLNDISKHSHRYSMFKVGPVLSVSHGMGIPSLSILLHEVFKMLWHAGVEDATFFRIGTCGGINLPPGTVVVSEGALDGKLQPVHENIVLGKIVSNEAELDLDLAYTLFDMGKELPFDVVTGKTVATNDFYEGQARLDGAFCGYTPEDKYEYLLQLKEAGVSNIEMEATCFAALTHMAGFRAAIVCVTLVNRLDEDQVTPTKETMLAWQNRPQRLVAKFIKQQLSSQNEARKSPNNTESKNTRRQSPPDQKFSPPSLRARRRTSNSSESSVGGIDSYEDESLGSKKFPGGGSDGNRVRIDSVSQITGVRFDDPN